MQDASYNAYNTVFNQLQKCANQYYALSVAYDNENLYGFSAFAMNESEERWEYSECIRHYLARNNKKVVIADMPAPIQDFPDMGPKDVLNKAFEHDKAILNAINSAISGVEPGELVYMTKLKDIMQGQHNEVHDYITKMGFSGSSIYEVNELLFKKFGHEYEDNPCHK